MDRLVTKRTGRTIAGMKLKLDLHDIYNHGGDIVQINRKLSGQTLFGHRRESRTLIAGEGRSCEQNHFHHLANGRCPWPGFGPAILRNADH